MKIKHFDKLQTFYLDAIWKRMSEGRDVPQILVNYAKMVDGEEGYSDPQDFAVELHGKLRDFPPVDPDHGKWRTWGFAVPFHGQPEDVLVPVLLRPEDGQPYEQSLVVEIPGRDAFVICVEKREKVLPSSTINDKLFERAKAMKEREQRDLNRKDYAILKEEIIAAELKKAPVRRVRTYLMLDRDDLHVFTGSQKTAEESTALLRNAISSLPTVPAFTSEVVMCDLFKKILLGKGDHFDVGTYVKMRNDEKEVITIKDADLRGDTRARELLDGTFNILEMEFSYRNRGGVRTWVKMNHKADIKYLGTEEDDDRAGEFGEQYEVGEAGYQSKIAELWVLVHIIRDLHEGFREAGVMVDRAAADVSETGDELDDEHQLRIRTDCDEDPDGEEAEEDEADDDDEWKI